MNFLPPSPRSGDRVRQNTRAELNEQIDIRTRANVERLRTQPTRVIAARIRELDREWDIERWLEANASVLALSGVVLGATANRKWLLLSGAVLGFLLLHATQGWCPPLPVLRARGVRTRSEIAFEQQALAAIVRTRQEAMPTLREARGDAPLPTPTEFAAALQRAMPDVSPLA